MAKDPTLITDELIAKVVAKVDAAIDSDSPTGACHWLRLLEALTEWKKR